MSNNSKRIPVVLSVQTDVDRRALKNIKDELEKALSTVDAGLKAMETVQPAPDDEVTEFELDSITRPAWNRAWEAAQLGITRWGYRGAQSTQEDLKYDAQYYAQRSLQGAFALIWNEALETAAQVTGGPTGTIIRDLKIDKD